MNAPLRLLAIDSSTDTLSVALGTGAPGAALATFTGPGAAQASSSLLPAVQDLLARADWPLDSLDAIVFGRGPGSFTGLRTACAVAQGLAYGARSARHPGGLPVLPVDTLLALAQAAWQAGADAAQPPPQRVVALLDARMGEMYVALYASGPQGVSWPPLAAPRLCAPAQLADWLAQTLGASGAPGAGLLAGNVWQAYAAELAPALAAWPGQSAHALPSAEALLSLAPALLAAGQAVAAHEALPLYVRDKVAQTTAEREQARA